MFPFNKASEKAFPTQHFSRHGINNVKIVASGHDIMADRASRAALMVEMCVK